MKKRKLFMLALLVGAGVAGMYLLDKKPDAASGLLFLSFPFLLGHTVWIQSSIGYNIMQGRKTNIFFGWGHHLPVHDPICSLGKQWVKKYSIYEPDGNVIHRDIDGSQAGFECIPYECIKEGTYRLASSIDTGYYTIYQEKGGAWHHFTEPLDTMEHPDQVEKILISLKYWEWTKAIMTVGTPSNAALEPLGQEMEIMLDKNPVEYKAGDTVHFKVFKDGKPLTDPGASFFALDQGRSAGFDDYLYDRVPLNEDGTGSFEITRPAVWHLKVQWGYPAPKEYENKCWIFGYICSITFQVDPEWGIKSPSYKL